MHKTVKTCILLIFAFSAMVPVMAEEEFTQITGRAREGYEEARRDAIKLLILHLGTTEIFKRYLSEATRLTEDVQNPNGYFNTISTREKASISSMIHSHAVLPPIYKIDNSRDEELYYTTIYVKNSDLEKFFTIIDVLRYFPFDKQQEESIMDFYIRKVIALKTNFTTGQASALANLLEKQFFISTVIRKNTIYIYPRDRYETRILAFFTQCFGRVQKNGNEIQLSQFDFTMLERQNSLNLRIIRIDSDTPIPNLNYIMRQNGLDIAGKQSANERFACTINFSEYNKSFSTSIKVDIEIVDRLDEQLLLSTTLISPNFPKYSNIQAKVFMKNKTAEYIQAALPWILAAY